MKRKSALPELLAPAGSFEALLAAISAGADAIYVGGKAFGARAYAKNFDIEELKRATEICHLHGVKLYVTVNTLVYDRELGELSDYAARLYEIGVDALICADLGAIAEIRRRVPNMEIHASTQASVHNRAGADLLYSLGAKRVVLARELSEKDIESTTQDSLAEIEIFLHGALCVCHSGQCLMSSLVGGRSGNRGECAQPCRLPYGKGYQLSLRDLSLARHIKRLVDLGVSSLKIEGRMKSPDYVYRTTKIYRRLLDGQRNATDSEENELKAVFSRGGFTDGYFKGRLESGMLGIRSGEDKNDTRALKTEVPPPKKIRINASAEILLGSPARLTFTLGERSVTVFGDAAEPAQNAPLTEDSVKARLMKLGTTELTLAEEDISLKLGEGVNLSPAKINDLRRRAAEALTRTERECAETEKFSQNQLSCPPVQRKHLKTAYFYNPKILSEIKERSPESLKIFDKIFIPLFRLSELEGANAGIALPPVIFDSELCEVREMLAAARERGITEALISNVSHLSLASEYGFRATGDFRLNITNSLTRIEYERLGVSDMISSPELTLPMARDVGTSVIVYGRIPLMLTERCFIKDSYGCTSCGTATLTDRTGAKFPLLREYPHRNILLNSTPTYMGDKQEELASARLYAHHFIFTLESAKETIGIISAYKAKKPLPFPVRRMGKR